MALTHVNLFDVRASSIHCARQREDFLDLAGGNFYSDYRKGAAMNLLTSSGKKWNIFLIFMTVAVAGIHCLPDVLIWRYRKFYQQKFPEIASQWQANGRFVVASPLDDPDSYTYLTRVGETAGQNNFGLPPLRENHGWRWFSFDFADFWLQNALLCLTGNISAEWLLNRALGCGLWFITLYFLLAQLSRNRGASLASATFGCLFADLFWGQLCLETLISPKDILTHAFWLLGPYKYNFGCSRLTNSALTWPVFFLGFYLMARAMQERSRAMAVASGFSIGSLVYLHADMWHYAFVASAIFTLLWSLQQRKLDFLLAALLGISFVIAIPWLWINYPIDVDWLARLEVEYGRAFDFTGLIYAVLFGVCWRFYRRDPVVLSLGCVLIASVILLEAHCFIGYQVQAQRWRILGSFFTLLIAIGLIGRRVKERPVYLWITALLVILAVGRSVSYAAQHFVFQGLPGDVDGALRFLEKDIPKHSVVAVLGPLEGWLIPTYAQKETFIPSEEPKLSDISNEALVRRLHRALEIYGISEKKFLEWALKQETANRQAGPPRWDTDLWRGKLNWAASEMDHFHTYYFNVTPRPIAINCLNSLKTLPSDRRARVDYIWVGPFEQAFMGPEAVKKLGVPAYQNSTIRIFPYRLRS